MGLRKLSSGGYWYIDLYYKGRRIQKSTGTKNKALAEKILAKQIADIHEEKYFPDKKKSQKVTIGELFDRFLEYSKANHHTNTTTYYHYNFLPLREFMNTELLENLTEELLDKYKIKRQENNISPVTINHEIKVLKTSLNKAIDWKIITYNPILKVKKLREGPKRLRYLTIEEMQRLLSCCTGSLYCVVRIALETGMRKSEVLSLVWKDIDLENQIILFTDAKTKIQRNIYISQELSITIKQIPQNGEYLFPFKEFKHAWHTALKKADIQNFRYHDLRRNHFSWLIMAGIAPHVAIDRLGWKDYNTADIYLSLSPEIHKKAAETISELLKSREFLGNQKKNEPAEKPTDP